MPDFNALRIGLKKATVSPEFVRRVNNEVVKTIILPRMKMGVSPVRGWGRYERYKNPEKYPGDLKPKRPVNLYLTGRLQENYKAEARGDDLHVGVSSSAPKEVKEYAGYLQDGTEHMVRRPIVPSHGEEWSVAVQRQLLKIFSDVAKKLFYRTKTRRSSRERRKHESS